MKLAHCKTAAANVCRDVNKNHTLAFAAGLSYYFLMGIFPALIALASVVGYLPIPNLFNEILSIMSRFVPPDSMGLVRKIVSDVITPNRGALLSFGVVGLIWAVSGGFAATIEALNVAYDVPETRPYWKTRSLAIGLTFLIGTLMVSALAVVLVGPRFGEWLANELHLSIVWAMVWPYLQWGLSIAFTVIGIEALYFLGPNVKSSFRSTLVGAVLAVSAWLLLSYGLGFYFRHFAHFNKTYGTLGGAVALMVWFYWTGFAILLGAEVNSEIMQLSGNGKITLKQPPPAVVTPKPGTEGDIAA